MTDAEGSASGRIHEGEDGTLRRTATIVNSRGLHARAAAKFVKKTEEFAADVVVRNGDLEVSGRSIMGLLMLAASPGKTIEMRATGAQARDALQALAQLIDDKFHEAD
ncbi:HPr family phosphocarrier protein [Novispirillum sp. DQ9]|uniref:HPr family phosphocarrier protein n=1 Tax=Novispirillum sp. DQ9 TaxID=3398612 RepID=UPI003C7D2A4F